MIKKMVKIFNNKKQKNGMEWRNGIMAGVGVACIGLLTSCGSLESQEIQVEITDAYEISRFEARQGLTVQQLLEEAEISVKPEDKVSPGLEQVVSRDQKIQISRNHEVRVSYEDEKPITVTLQGGDVSDAIAKAGVTLDDSTAVNMDLDRHLNDGMEIVISKLAFVKVKADGKLYKEFTDTKTVKELLSQLGISLGKRDRVSNNLKDPVSDGMQLVINRVTVKKETEIQDLPFERKQEQTSDLEVGTTRIKQAGVSGEKELTYRVVYVDGAEESREIIKENVTKEPVDEIILSGTRPRQTETPPAPAANSEPSNGGANAVQDSGAVSERTVVSVQNMDDCDGSGHGVRITKYSDGTEELEEY